MMNANCYNVLLVDDDLVQVDLARRAAAECCPEISLTGVGWGDAALDWFNACLEHKGHMPHIILLDLKLPKLDGLAVLRKLRMHDVTRDIPIVVFSAEYTQDDVLMSYQIGANSFVPKPADIAQFSEFLHERLAYWKHPQQRELIFAAKDETAEKN
jgi:two-component system, response regulator